MSAARLFAACIILTASLASATFAADYPPPRQGDFIAHDFKFHTGEVMHELRLHYTTIGEPTGAPVLLLHGTGGSGANFLTKAFADEMFGLGKPLDAGKYFIILPDAIGARRTTTTATASAPPTSSARRASRWAQEPAR